MITTPKLGNGGRLANQIMAYMSLTGLADKHDKELVLPELWKYSKYFKGCEDNHGFFIGNPIKEKNFHYDEYPEISDAANISLTGYLQSWKYWQHIEKQVRDKFSWNESEFSHLPKHRSDGIAIHIRRADYVQNQAYAQLGIDYYIQALIENFPDWQKSPVFIFSDDPAYCKLHFSAWNNIIISEGRSDIEDMYLMSQSKNMILSNSSYSWLGAYFAETIHGKCKVIRPINHFSGSLANLSIDDFYPERWIPFESINKIPLKDVTFTIPVFFDHPDRKKNMDLSICLLQHYFDTNIILMENKSLGFGYMSAYVQYERCDHGVFHRTRMLNDMAKLAKTKYIVNWDADVVLPPMQIFQAVEKLRSGIDMVYPYDGTFARVPRVPYFKQLESGLDIGLLSAITFKGMYENDKKSFGGAVMWNLEAFLKAGGENENFISFGAEDYERYERAEKLGYKIERVHGALFHIDHWVGVNSSTRNPYFNHNRVEFEKVKAMSKEELQEYIKSWD